MSKRIAAPEPCVDCGQMVVRRRRSDRIIRCLACAALQIEAAALQMANKSGPVWDAWCASNAAGAPGRTHKPKE